MLCSPTTASWWVWLIGWVWLIRWVALPAGGPTEKAGPDEGDSQDKVQLVGHGNHLEVHYLYM